MHLEQIPRFLDRLRREIGIVYRLGWPNSSEALADRMNMLGVTFPDPVLRFYGTFDGLYVEDPRLEIYRLDELVLDESGLLPFVGFDSIHRLAFDTRRINIAGQWDIMNPNTGCRISHSMPAFWTDHIWNWVRFRHPIWTYDR